MKIALIGYGKMGQAIERIALSQGHEVVLKITHENLEDFTDENLRKADVAIEFTQPEAAFTNVSRCLRNGIPVISGTTGWNEKTAEAGVIAKENETAFLHASNFSLGVNLFFAISEFAASLLQKYPQYKVSMEEVHHTAKKDAPSGTAITLAERILGQYDSLSNWQLGQSHESNTIGIVAKRIEDVPGTHTLLFESAVDNISLTHTAHNREGFAQGAVLAAAFVRGKKGVFTMQDVLGLSEKIGVS